MQRNKRLKNKMYLRMLKIVWKQHALTEKEFRGGGGSVWAKIR